MDEPKVSVIVPIYNTENELPRCIQSIQDQTFSDIEIILVDDGSTDSCPQICDDYAKHDPRIRVLHKENGGVSDTRNTGILAARGEYLLQVDSDDYLEKDAVEQLLRGALPGIDLIAGGHYCVDGEERKRCIRNGLEDRKIYTAKDFIVSSIRTNDFWVMPWAYMYRRKYLLENEIFYTKDRYFEDLDLALDLLLHASGIIVVNIPFYNYVKREGSITQSENSLKKIHDNVGALKRWKETIEGVKDKTLQKYLYFELNKSYQCMCFDRNLLGWWIPGMNLKYALIHFPGKKAKKNNITFALKTLYYKYFSPNNKSYIFPDQKIINDL